MKKLKKKYTMQLFAKPHEMDLVERAAALTFKSCEDFILDASYEKALEVLLDQSLYIVSEEQFDAFEKAFSQPLSENKGFQNLMSDKYSF